MGDNRGQKNIILFLSSIRPGRMADRVVKTVKDEIEACGNRVILFDPSVMNFEVLKTPLHFMTNPDDAPSWMKDANTQLQIADAFVILTAEYNSSVPPALVNMLDHFPPASYRHRPCAIISYSVGELGGIRCQNLLQILTIELGMLNIPRHLNIPNVGQIFNEAGECSNYKICTEIARLIHEVDWFAEAIRNKKKTAAPPS